MITAHYPAIRKITHYGSPFVMGQHVVPFVAKHPTLPDTRILNLLDKWKIDYMEFKRRDSVIQELHRMCPYVRGDRVVPKDTEKRRAYGVMTLVGICKDIFDLAHDDIAWPPNDNPMIVTCSYDDNGEVVEMLCTTNFFMRAPNGGQC